MDLYSEALAAEVRAEVAAQGLGTKDIEAKLGLDYSSYRRYFMTLERSPRLDDIASAAAGLGLTPDELLRRARRRIERNAAKTS